MQTLLVLQTASLSSKRRLNLNGITRAADKLGWRVQTIESIPSQRQLDQIIELWNPRGIVIEGSGGTTIYHTPPSIPTVYLDGDPCTTNATSRCIRNDSPSIGMMVARELLSLNLHHFAFVAWHKPIYWCTEKLDAYAKTLEMHGAKVNVFQPTDRESRNHVALQKRLRAWLRELPKPCGLFAITDTVAEQVLSAAQGENITVPNDLAVIGVDNDESICERTYPTLTSVMPNFDATGYEAVMMLADPQSPADTKKVRPFGIIRRQSTRLSAKLDTRVNAALERIRREACNGLTAQDVVEMFPYSRRLAEKRFLSVTGMTILKAIHQERLERARLLLSDPRTPIKDIALQCGWNSDVIFRRMYKAAYGTPPRRSTHE